MVSKRRRDIDPPNTSLDELLDHPDVDGGDTAEIGSSPAVAPEASVEAASEPRPGRFNESIWRPDDGATVPPGAVQDDGSSLPDNGTRVDGATDARFDHVEHGDDGILDDEDFLPQEKKPVSRLTVTLIGVLVLGFGLLGGIWVQKSFGAQSAAAFPGGGQGFPGGGQGMPGGGMPSGFPGRGGGAGGSADGGSADGGSGNGGSGSTADSPAVVGTVDSVKSGRLTVEDFGGTKHEVKLTDTTTLTAPLDHRELKTGDTVSVVGTTAGDTITATAITVS